MPTTEFDDMLDMLDQEDLTELAGEMNSHFDDAHVVNKHNNIWYTCTYMSLPCLLQVSECICLAWRLVPWWFGYPGLLIHIAPVNHVAT